MIVNTANIIVWRWENTHPFGANLPDEDPDSNAQLFEYHPRSPGQYFNRETNLQYNYFRYYEPETGWYVSPDPIGLAEGINIYGYVEQNPLSFIGPIGEILIAPIIIGGLIGATFELGSQLLNNGEESCAIDRVAVLKGALIGAIPGGILGNIGRFGVLGNFIGKKVQVSLQGTRIGKGGSINKGPFRFGVGDAPGGTARIRIGLPGKNNKIDLIDLGSR